MGDESLKLTADESKLILETREKKAQEIAKKMLVFRYLQTAWEYALWLDENGAGSTYSTFCDDFEYEGAPGEDRPNTYKMVLDLIEIARGMREAGQRIY